MRRLFQRISNLERRIGEVQLQAELKFPPPPPPPPPEPEPRRATTCRKTAGVLRNWMQRLFLTELATSALSRRREEMDEWMRCFVWDLRQDAGSIPRSGKPDSAKKGPITGQKRPKAAKTGQPRVSKMPHAKAAKTQRRREMNSKSARHQRMNLLCVLASLRETIRIRTMHRTERGNGLPPIRVHRRLSAAKFFRPIECNAEVRAHLFTVVALQQRSAEIGVSSIAGQTCGETVFLRRTNQGFTLFDKNTRPVCRHFRRFFPCPPFLNPLRR